ncbi:atp-binding cassette transporter subfamily a abca [Holotrichia oblita]|uniref:Atp-binding cassette transporter subfamily a abca n=1 Tax=Holotrichia oblita TaxID=644536 RepID=A0ACB9T813_HOLOL|nr:atp-binding cassette transporter subfamily a abca [Holotrichia oblita]
MPRGFKVAWNNPSLPTINRSTKPSTEIMKIMGVNNWLHWIAWYLSTLLFSLIIIIVNAIILTTPITKEDAVFSNVDRKVLIVFFLIYISTMITFAFAVTVFFTRASMATIVGEILFMVLTIPYFLPLTFLEKLSSCLLVNTAFLRGIQIIVDHEMIFKKLAMDNIFDPVSENESLSLGLVMMMLILDTFIYMLIVLYVEAIFPGEYGLPRVWYFPFTVKFWCSKSAVSERVKTFIHEDNYYEPEPVDQKIGIQVLHLKKQYGKHRIILRDLSFNMFEGEVTILLGHNGAGKTTTMSILSGILPTTHGTAIINGYDIRTDMDKIRRSLGFCPQNNVLFDLLTAREHLYFYCKMRGLRGHILKEEINKYLRLLDFSNKKEVVSKALSGGMKRKLCTGIALCGNSKICILDEPTSGMDPTNRRLLWDVIQSEKAGRTILLSTHFMNEADVLGDRIAILANGRLQCYGSSYFLKKRYGSGYRLVIVKDSQCKAEQITAFLQGYIPQLKIETDVGRELTYILPEFHVRIFEKMLSNMDNSRKSLGIESYGISLATLEEVFIRVGAECDEDNDNRSNTVLEAGLLDNHETYLTGFALYRNQLLAMMLKRALVTMRSWLVLIALTVLAVITAILIMETWRTGSQISSSPRLDFTLDSYSSPVTVITATTKNNTYYKNYKEILQNENRKIVDRGNEDMNDYLLKKTNESMDQVRTHFIIGAAFFGNNTIVAWFNDQPYHSPPLALQYVYNSILKEKVGPDYNIEFGNYPFRETTQKFLAVNQLCIGIKQYECFGLLGVNGAGKTTVFRMMTGDLRLSYGDAWICQLNIKNNMKDIHRCIGYCPQFDGLLDNLTVKETLIMYCLIRGIPLGNCSAAAIRLSQELQFTNHINKRINNLSGGNKRKVSAAIALIGEPPVLFLDEPSTGMDPKTKRFLWDKLCRIRDNGRCLVLTTHSMDECEAICTRVGIMVNGAFQCLGSSQYLKNKFADGYVLIIKVKKGADLQELQSNIQDVKLFIDTNFRGAELKESHGRLLSYIVKGKRISWPAIFGTMERGKTAVKGMEDYSLSQFDLEQVRK